MDCEVVQNILWRPALSNGFYGLYNQSRSDMCVAVILSRIINAVVRDHQQYDRVVKQQF